MIPPSRHFCDNSRPVTDHMLHGMKKKPSCSYHVIMSYLLHFVLRKFYDTCCYPYDFDTFLIWLVVEPPLWNIWVRQLGYVGMIILNHGKIAHVPNHPPVMLSTQMISLPSGRKGWSSFPRWQQHSKWPGSGQTAPKGQNGPCVGVQPVVNPINPRWQLSSTYIEKQF